MEQSVDVIIPVYKPDRAFPELMRRLQRQTHKVNKIILMNTEEKYWNPDCISGYDNVEVYHLKKAEFDHGGTRRRAAEMSDAAYMVFMTQDAMPKDSRLIENLLKEFEKERVKAVYARQLPARDCRILEQYTRTFNYPEKSFVKGKEDLQQLGIKTYFCSNVCAAYEKETYEALGGFVDRAIFNEDMIYAAGLIQSGYRIAYASDARVVHSHNYNCRQQFHRNFDLGVSQAEHPEIFEGIPSEGEGMKLVKKSAVYAIKIGRPDLWIPLFFQSAFKYLGYLMGKNYRKLPRRVILFCTMSKDYWK